MLAVVLTLASLTAIVAVAWLSVGTLAMLGFGWAIRRRWIRIEVR